MSDIKWHILIDAIAAIVIAISFFFTDHLMVIRVALLIFAAADVIMMVYRQKMIKSVFFIVSAIFLLSIVISGLPDIYLIIFGIVLVTASYRTLFEKYKETKKPQASS